VDKAALSADRLWITLPAYPPAMEPCHGMTRTPLSRPALLPGVARLWRDDHTLQIGLDPARAVLLDLPNARAGRLLDLLTGDQPERVVLARARHLGIRPEDAVAILDCLHAAGLVVGGHALLPPQLPASARQRLFGEAVTLALRTAEAARRRVTSATSATSATSTAGTAAGRRGGERTPAQVLRRRATARVVVAGRGRLAAPLAVAMAQAGVGHVRADVPGRVDGAELAGGPLTEVDIGRPRTAAVADAVARAAPGTRTGPVRRGTAELIVQLAYDQPVELLSAGYLQRRQAHLAVTIREGTAVVGPLVPSTGAPCLNCLDLHRLDRDPGWSRLAAQLICDAAEPCGVATVLAATAYAAAEVLAYLDGGAPETVGAAVEIAAPGRHRRRAWPPHPACGCTRRRRPTTPPTTRRVALAQGTAGRTATVRSQ
jgi:hypothetical protein